MSLATPPAPMSPWYAVVIRPPGYRVKAGRRLGPSLSTVEQDSVAALAGPVEVVVRGDFVAVAAPDPATARRAAARLKLTWSEPTGSTPAAHDLATRRETHPPSPTGDESSAISRDYRWPARMRWGEQAGWMIADCSATGLSVWGQTQTPEALRADLARLTGLAPDTIILHGHHQGLGRHCGDDAAADAALVSAILDRPVAVWLSAEDYGADVLALGWARTLRARAEQDGGAGPRLTVTAGTAAAVPVAALWLMAGAGAGAGGADMPSELAHAHLASDSLIDEHARSLGQDPLAARFTRITDARGRVLLDQVARRAGWGTPGPAGPTGKASLDVLHGRGLSYAHFGDGDGNGLRAAWITDVTVNPVTGDVALTRVVVGQDRGDDAAGAAGALEQHPGLNQALEQGLFPALPAADQWSESAPDRPAPPARRPSETSLRSPGPQAGGVPALPADLNPAPAVAAVANALFDATGVRFRDPPFSPSRVRAALAKAGPGLRPPGRKTSRRWWLAAALAVAGAGAALWPWKPALAPIARPAANLYSQATIDQGRRVALVGDCVVCHTDQESGTENTGGRPFDTPFGTLYSTNITPDPDTGIGNWSYAAFERAMRHGVSRDGRHLYPAFPYTAYAKLSDADMQALYAYLMSRPAVAASAPENRLRFPFNVRGLMAGWNALYHDLEPFRPDPERSALWNRGAYLAEGAGHCSACHSPRNAFGAEQGGERHLAGAMVDGWQAPPLNSLSASPVPWTEATLFQYLRSGQTPWQGPAGGPMAPVVAGLAELPEQDVRAIAHYVASQMGAPGDADHQQRAQRLIAAAETPPPGLEEGQRLFDGACAACHDNGALPSLTAARQSLALNGNLHARRPDNLIQSILGGVHARGVPGVGDMPGFAESFTDSQVTRLVAYLRARFASGEARWTEVGKTVGNIRREHNKSH